MDVQMEEKTKKTKRSKERLEYGCKKGQMDG